MRHEGRQTKMIEVVPYRPELASEWNRFVLSAKNGHFMFCREYMEYHADRFQDHSLLFYEGQRLVALLPANREAGTLCTHAGLTFGGVVSDSRMTTSTMFEVVKALVEHARDSGISAIEYRAQPFIYWEHPSGEDLFVLWRAGAQLVRRDLTTTIDCQRRLEYRSAKRQTLRKTAKLDLRIAGVEHFERFWALVTEVLRSRHDSRPVHSVEEISLLNRRFPANIRLFECLSPDGELLAGAVLYLNRQVVHTQYLAASDRGRELGALDHLLDHLIRHFQDARYFDFGRSTTKDGALLNEGLVFQKEGFGGRGVTHDFYRLLVP